MRRMMVVVAALVAAVAAPGGAEVGIGLVAGYPHGMLVGESWPPAITFDPRDFFAGADLRWMPSDVLVDAGLMAWLQGGVFYGNFDLGAAFDLLFLRLGLAAGVDMVWLEEGDWPGWEAVRSAPGVNAKAFLDVRLGTLTLGLSCSIPLDLFWAPIEGDAHWVERHSLRRLALHGASLNLLTWHGPRSGGGQR